VQIADENGGGRPIHTNTHTLGNTHTYTHIYINTHIYTYIDREREREKERDTKIVEASTWRPLECR